MWHARNRSSAYPDCATTRLLPRLRRRIFERNVQVLLRVWCSTLRECSGQHRTLLLQLWKPNSNCLIRVLLPLRGQGALSVTDPFQPPAGKLAPAIDRTYPLGEVAAAIRHMLDGKARGKLSVSVSVSPGCVQTPATGSTP
jgi:hypothetical protein